MSSTWGKVLSIRVSFFQTQRPVWRLFQYRCLRFSRVPSKRDMQLEKWVSRISMSERPSIQSGFHCSEMKPS